MSILAQHPLDQLRPARLFASLDPALRTEAAAALYQQQDPTARATADAAIARVLKFRAASVRKLPVERKAGYLAKLPLDETLAATLLQALHLEKRRPLLAAFLDACAIPHKDGLIDGEAQPKPPSAEVAAAAIAKLRAGFPEAEVDVYLLTLLALDPETWQGVRTAIEKR